MVTFGVEFKESVVQRGMPLRPARPRQLLPAGAVPRQQGHTDGEAGVGE
jgi:hypothetical protein